jgi:hypothetical protein
MDLPIELWDLIFSYLGAVEVARFRRASKKCNGLIESLRKYLPQFYHPLLSIFSRTPRFWGAGSSMIAIHDKRGSRRAPCAPSNEFRIYVEERKYKASCNPPYYICSERMILPLSVPFNLKIVASATRIRPDCVLKIPELELSLSSLSQAESIVLWSEKNGIVIRVYIERLYGY